MEKEKEGIILNLNQQELTQQYRNFVLNCILSFLLLEDSINLKELKQEENKIKNQNENIEVRKIKAEENKEKNELNNLKLFKNNSSKEKDNLKCVLNEQNKNANNKYQDQNKKLQEQNNINQEQNRLKNEQNSLIEAGQYKIQVVQGEEIQCKQKLINIQEGIDDEKQQCEPDIIYSNKMSLIQAINEYQFRDYQIMKQKFIVLKVMGCQNFNDINKNIPSKTFEEQQISLIQILKSRNYYLYKYFTSNSNEDIFIGYSDKYSGDYLDYVFMIKYKPTLTEIIYYVLTLKFYEEVNHFVLRDFTHIFIFSKDTFVQIYGKFNNLSIMKSEWSKEYFDLVNKDKAINLESCHKCKDFIQMKECSEYTYFRKFQLQKNIVLEQLQQRNYYLCEYLNKGGQGIIFGGCKQSFRGKQDLIFKILFDCGSEDLQEELNIMKRFEQYIPVIKYEDQIKINESVNVLILEKCQFSLKGELDQIRLKQLFPLEKLLRMIFNLVDGLIQLRIYSVILFDIKPQNILLSHSEKYLYTDFGISSAKKQNQQAIVKGWTRFFASPEQQENNSEIDFQSDVYSLGKTFEVILYLFKNIQKQRYKDLVDKFSTIIQKNMLQCSSNQRSSCLELSKQFFQEVLMQYECQPFLYLYIQEMKDILKLQPYDKNKEVKYFLQISLFYSQNVLTLQENFSQVSGQELNKDITHSLSNSGSCYQKIGDSLKALEYQLRSLQMRKQMFKNSYKDILNSYSSIGECYYSLGDYKQSVKYQLEYLDLVKLIFKSEHDLIAKCLNNIGNCYQSLGNSNKALNYFQKSLSIRRKFLIENSHEMSNTLENIGYCLGKLGKQNEALEYALQSLQIKKKLFVESHPSISFSLDVVGLCYRDLGESQKALQYLEESLQSPRYSFISESYVGLCYLSLGEYQKALQHSLESLQMKKIILRENHPNIAVSLDNVGLCYKNLGESKKALEYHLESLIRILKIVSIKIWNYLLIQM